MDAPKCFVLMPFSDEFEEVYHVAIVPAVASLGFRCERADIGPPGAGAIMQDVIEGIFGADILVADLTGNKPNVLYELGIAHTIHDTTLLVREDSAEPIPFDLSSFKVLSYTRSARGLKDFRQELTSRLASAAAWTETATNPVRQFGPPSFQVPYSSHSRENALAELFEFEGDVIFQLSIEERGGRHFVRESDVTVARALSAYFTNTLVAREASTSLDDPHYNLIVVGSTRFNDVARAMQEHFDLPYQYVSATADDSPITRVLRIVTQHGDELSSSRDNYLDIESGTDYGLIFVANLAKGKKAIWISGIHGRGTIGVYLALVACANCVVSDLRTLGSAENTGVAYLVRVRYGEESNEASMLNVESEILGHREFVRRREVSDRSHALLVDMGGVLMEFDRTQTYRAIAHHIGRDYKTVQSIIESSDIRSRYEQGRLTDDEFCSELAGFFGGDDTLCALLPEMWGDIFWPNYEMFESLWRLKQRNVRLILLSNTNGLHFAHVKRDYPEVMDLFDDFVLSFEFGAEKPALEIFQRAADVTLERHAVSRDSILYVDDTPQYVQVARKLGIRGFTYLSHSHFVYWLRKQGLYID